MLTLVLLFGCAIFAVEAVPCDTVYPGVPTFNNCKQRCHCKNDAKCDGATGACNNGCARGWAGPACQYRDVTEGYAYVGQIGITESNSYTADKAVDGDVNTCSKGLHLFGTYAEWIIELEHDTLIGGVHLDIPSNELDNFYNFKIFLSPNGANYSVECYVHSGVPVNARMDIACARTQLARYLKVQLGIQDKGLSLCEVYIYSGREVAFNKQTYGSGIWTNSYAPSAVVDGQTFNRYYNFTGCYSSAPVENQWWIADLGISFLVLGVNVNMRDHCCFEQVRGFNVSLKEETTGEWTLIHNDTGRNYINQEAVLEKTYSIRYVRLAKKLDRSEESDKDQPFSICEVKVFGECPDGLCGWDCTDTCHCDVPPTGSHRIEGTCPTGCQQGYRGDIGTHRCDTTCPESQWGDICQRNCGNCITFPCYSGNGSCVDGCSGPWYPPMCTETCNDGWYGVNCEFQCSEHCRPNTCNKSTGSCACEGGWKGPRCLEKCPSFTYGSNCEYTCGHCADPRTCDPVSGYCHEGCLSGATGDKCEVLSQEAISTEIVSTVLVSCAASLVAFLIGVLLTVSVYKLLNKRRARKRTESDYETTSPDIEDSSRQYDSIQEQNT